MIKLGATGKFPRGRLTEEDEGELQMAVAHRDGNIVLDFGKPVVWIGSSPKEARQIAALFIKHADAIEEVTSIIDGMTEDGG